jgi:hypothetical protein
MQTKCQRLCASERPIVAGGRLELANTWPIPVGHVGQPRVNTGPPAVRRSRFVMFERLSTCRLGPAGPGVVSAQRMEVGCPGRHGHAGFKPRRHGCRQYIYLLGVIRKRGAKPGALATLFVSFLPTRTKAKTHGSAQAVQKITCLLVGRLVPQGCLQVGKGGVAAPLRQVHNGPVVMDHGRVGAGGQG